VCWTKFPLLRAFRRASEYRRWGFEPPIGYLYSRGLLCAEGPVRSARPCTVAYTEYDELSPDPGVRSFRSPVRINGVASVDDYMTMKMAKRYGCRRVLFPPTSRPRSCIAVYVPSHRCRRRRQFICWSSTFDTASRVLLKILLTYYIVRGGRGRIYIYVTARHLAVGRRIARGELAV
jgi:hypothetical protein